MEPLDALRAWETLYALPSAILLGTAGSLMYSIRSSLLNKYSLGYIVLAARRHWYEVLWLLLVTTGAAFLVTELLALSLPHSHLKAVLGFLLGAAFGSGATFVERRLWNVKIGAGLVLRPTHELGFAVLTRLDRSAGIFERADNDAWQCQSGYWNVGIEPGMARNRMRLLFEASKEKLVAERGMSDIYRMDARWHPGNYFFLLVHFYGRRRLRKLLGNPPRFEGLRKDWSGEATRKTAGKPNERKGGYRSGDSIRRYDHLG